MNQQAKSNRLLSRNSFQTSSLFGADGENFEIFKKNFLQVKNSLLGNLKKKFEAKKFRFEEITIVY